MSERHAVLLAASCWMGAIAAREVVPLWVSAVVVVAALLARRPLLLCAGAVLLTSVLGARAWQGLQPPPRGTGVDGIATLVTDPEWTQFGSLRFEARIGGRRVEASARGLPAARLQARLAGERVAVRGELRPVTGRAAGYLHNRHVAARLAVTGASEMADDGAFVDRAGNRLRRAIERGASSLPDRRRALLAGFLFGDDRGQEPAVVADFRAAGLSHLLAVSGQNVALLLAAASPFLARLRLTGRLVAALAILAVFGAVTRWEPSVLRAVAMATVAMSAAAMGRPASSVRLLSVAVAVLLVIDPLLARSLGFQLSVAACAGIAALAARLAPLLPAPRSVSEVIAVTIGAQVGVAPLLVTAFGGVPLVALPANVLAAPAAGPITTWGLGAGLVAGLAGGTWARLLHIPTSLMLMWVETVARLAAALPVGELHRGDLMVLTGCAVVAAFAGRRVRRLVAAVAVATIGLATVAPLRGGHAVIDGVEIAPGVTAWRDRTGTIVLVDRPDAGAALTALRRRAIRRIDVLVSASGSSGAASTVGVIRDRVPVRLLIVPPGHQFGSDATSAAGTYRVGCWEIVVPGRAPARVGSVGCD